MTQTAQPVTDPRIQECVIALACTQTDMFPWQQCRYCTQSVGTIDVGNDVIIDTAHALSCPIAIARQVLAEQGIFVDVYRVYLDPITDDSYVDYLAVSGEHALKQAREANMGAVEYVDCLNLLNPRKGV